jgi:hypothetical protein
VLQEHKGEAAMAKTLAKAVINMGFLVALFFVGKFFYDKGHLDWAVLHPKFLVDIRIKQT